jgi:beta-alanine--pyruvate transaminase
MDRPEASLAHHWMPFTANSAFRAHPRLVVRGQGIRYETDDGRTVLDAMCGLMCSPAGHGRPEIAEAVGRQALELSYVAPFQHAHPAAFELAERLCRLTPDGLDHVFFTNSGSESVETALKMALLYHHRRGEAQRTRFVGRERGYHGVNFGGMSVGGIGANRDGFGPGLPGVVHLRHTLLPDVRFHRGQPPHGAELADDLQRFCDHLGGQNIAACIVEPVAGSTGVLVPPVGYLERLREICDAHGILLIFDEVITGFGRLARNFGGQRFGVTPDLITTAKGLTNGALPMGAVVASDRVHEAITEGGRRQGIEFYHGYTYSAHPVACAAGLAALEIFERDGLVDRARKLEDHFLDAVFSLGELPVVTDVRGIGMMAAVDVAPLDRPGARGLRLIQELWDAGVLVKFTGDTFLVGPALVIEPAEIDEIVSRVRAVLERQS